MKASLFLDTSNKKCYLKNYWNKTKQKYYFFRKNFRSEF